MITTLSPRARVLILAAAFLGWLCAGIQMGLGPLVARSAARDLLFVQGSSGQLLSASEEALVGEWFGRLLCAFLLGGALGGFLFGPIGDLYGRVRAMGLSILCFSVFSGLCYFVDDIEMLFVLRFLGSLGIGGMWPSGVALVAEAWPGASRPTVAGIMGTAANVGILVMALLGGIVPITPSTWRDAMLIGACPAFLGILAFFLVPESPRWLAERASRFSRSEGDSGRTAHGVPLAEVFRPPLLSRTLLGICLGTIPLLGTWASGKWMIPWAEKEGLNQANTQAIWAVGAVLGSAMGGWLASLCGRRLTYFLVSLITLALNLSIYLVLDPRHDAFLPAVFLLGLVATIFFGWLPLYLPELFPTRVRATGAGVTFNFGRIASAAGVLGAGTLMTLFEGSYARVGAVTAWVYALGMVVILFAPRTDEKSLQD